MSCIFCKKKGAQEVVRKWIRVKWMEPLLPTSKKDFAALYE